MARAACIALVGLSASTRADAQELDAQDVFRAFSPGVAKVEVYSAGASAPGAVGTAFFVRADGLLATNYHVVRDVVYEPDRYRAQIVLADVGNLEAEVVAVQGAHDLALLKVELDAPHVFELLVEPPDRGRRMFSLGHPADLATSVVEGTFNGSVEHRVSPRFHFTGSVNPGMSGGPAITREGQVVGVNVSTAGNQLSFLVPAAELLELLRGHATGTSPGSLLETVEQQFVDLQRAFLEPIVGSELTTTSLGAFQVPSGLSHALDCSAVSVDPEGGRYGGVRHTCETGDILLSYQTDSPELLSMTHIQLDSDELGPFRFHSAYGSFFQNLSGWLFPSNDQATQYECDDANVAAAVKIRAVVCARRNEKMPKLHEVFVRTAVLGKGTEGVVSTLSMGAVPLPLALRFVEQYLEAFTWTP